MSQRSVRSRTPTPRGSEGPETDMEAPLSPSFTESSSKMRKKTEAPSKRERIAQGATIHNLRMKVQTKKNDVRQSLELLQSEKDVVRETEGICEELEDSLGTLRHQRELPQGSSIAEVDDKIRQLEDELQHQRHTLSSQKGKAIEQEKLSRQLEKELEREELQYFKKSEDEERLAVSLSHERATAQKEMQKIVKREKKAAERIKREINQEHEQEREREREMEESARRQIDQAIEGSRQGKALMAALLGERREILSRAEVARKGKFDRNAGAVLELKANSEKAFNDMKNTNAEQQRRRIEREEEERQQFNELLAGGENPYEVFRRRMQKARAAREREKQHESIETAKLEIAKTMVNEDIRFGKIEQDARRHKLYVDQYRNSLGRRYTEEANKKYIQSVTTNGVDVVDPSGLIYRIEPSQVTSVKDHSFGLGRSLSKTVEQREAMIEKVKSKAVHRGVKPNPLLLPRQTRGSSSSTGGKEKGLDIVLPSDQAHIPGMDLRINRVYGSDEDEDEDEEEEERDTVGPEEEDGSQKDGKATQEREKEKSTPETSSLPPKRSILEKRMFADALKHQKENIVKKQIVMGKEFQGPAFVSAPSLLEFKDFEVGIPQEQRVVLTNVSRTFNTFKLLPLPQEVKNFVEVEHKPPGRMSAGVSCSLLVRFIPKVNRDISSHLPLLSETGPISIPIICKRKRVSISLSRETLLFKETVIGEERTLSITVENHGALGSGYKILRRSSKPTPSSSSADGVLNAAKEVDKENRPPTAEGPDGETKEFSEEALLSAAGAVQRLFIAEDHQDFELSSLSGSVDGYSKSTVKIRFRPMEVGEKADEFILLLDRKDEEDEDRHQDGEQAARTKGEIFFSAQGVALPLPVYVEQPTIDMRCCTYGKLYRTKLVLRNRGKTSLKCTLSPPAPLVGCVEFDPPFGFIQGCSSADDHGKFEVQLKFRPDKDLLQKIGPRWTIPSKGIFALPIRVGLTEQTLPVFFTLRGQLTTSDIEISPPSLAFGRCFVNQSTLKTVRIRNKSLLPQKIGFTGLKSEFEVQPADGFLILLPNEERSVDIIFTPSTCVEISSNLSISSTSNREFSLPCFGTGILPPLSLSKPVIVFGATAPGDSRETSIILSNNSRTHTYAFSFSLPKAFLDSGETRATKEVEKKEVDSSLTELRLMPSAGSLKPGQSLRLQVEFHPSSTDAPPSSLSQSTEVEDSIPSPEETEGDLQGLNDSTLLDGGQWSRKVIRAAPGYRGSVSYSDPSESQPLPAPPASKAGNLLSSPALEEIGRKKLGEPWSKHGKWVIPAYIRKVDGEGGRRSQAEEDEELPLLALEVHTTTVERILQPSVTKIKFGQVSIGEHEEISFFIRNRGTDAATLRLEPLNAVGPFSIVNAARPIPPNNGVSTLIVRFRPSVQQQYQEQLLIRSKTSELSLLLTGEGVSPSVALDPSDGKVFLGNLVENTTASKTVTVKNCSAFALTYRLETVGLQYSNFNGTMPFVLVPREATIPPGGEQQISITFSPDHEKSSPFESCFHVVIPTSERSKADQIIKVSGRCWSDALYSYPSDAHDEFPDAVGSVASGIAKKHFPSTLKNSKLNYVDDLLRPPTKGLNQHLAESLLRAAGQPMEKLRSYTLRFPREALDGGDRKKTPSSGKRNNTAQKSIVIGCAKSPTVTGGSFEIRFKSAELKYFSANPMKGYATSGTEATVTFTFTGGGPTKEKDGGEASYEDGIVSAGLWVQEEAIITLRPSEGSPVEVTYKLLGYTTV